MCVFLAPSLAQEWQSDKDVACLRQRGVEFRTADWADDEYPGYPDHTGPAMLRWALERRPPALVVTDAGGKNSYLEQFYCKKRGVTVDYLRFMFVACGPAGPAFVPDPKCGRMR